MLENDWSFGCGRNRGGSKASDKVFFCFLFTLLNLFFGHYSPEGNMSCVSCRKLVPPYFESFHLNQVH